MKTSRVGHALLTPLAMGARGAGVQFAQHCRARRRSAAGSRATFAREAHRPAACSPAICSRVTPGWMRRRRSSPWSRGSGSKTQRSVTSCVGPLVLTPSRARLSPPSPWPSEVMKSSLSTKLRLPLRHDDEDLAAGGRDLRRAAAARQPHLRLVVGADHGGVEVGEAVDLRAAEEADGDAPALQPVAEHLRHRHGGERGLAQLAVADRQRQHVGLGADGAGFVDQRDAGRMREPREVAAADGAPMPTKQTSSLRSARAAAMVIISVGLCSRPSRRSLRCRSARRACAAKASGPLLQHVRPSSRRGTCRGRARSRPRPCRRRCRACSSRARRTG